MGWVDRTSTNYWIVVNGQWDGEESRYIGEDNEGQRSVLLTATYDGEGGAPCWYCDQAQQQIRVTFSSTGDSDILVRLYDFSSNNIVYDLAYESLEEKTCVYAGENDIYRLAFLSSGSDLYVTKIEFYEDEEGVIEDGNTDYLGVVDTGDAELPLVGFNSDSGALTDVGDQETLNDGSLEGLALIDIGNQETLNDGSLESAEISDSGERTIEVERGNTDNAEASDTGDAFNYTKWLRENRNRYVLRYECRLTGSPDLDLPISSFQGRLRTGEQTYLGVTIPDDSNYYSAISARSSGQLVLDLVAYVGGVESLREELFRVDLDSIRTDRGATNRSITLSGHRTAVTGGNTVALENVSYRSLQANGKLRYRCAIPDLYIRPGDTATFSDNLADDSFTVGEISYTVSPTRQQMEVSES